MLTYRISSERREDTDCPWCGEPLYNGKIAYQYDIDSEPACSRSCAISLEASLGTLAAKSRR